MLVVLPSSTRENYPSFGTVADTIVFPASHRKCFSRKLVERDGSAAKKSIVQ